MKNTALILITAIMLTGCGATKFYRIPGDYNPQPVQRVENTPKQNWINFLIATWQSVLTVVGVGIIVSGMEDGIRDGFGGMRR